jgi:nucleoside-diphosphate-sugar epimerase
VSGPRVLVTGATGFIGRHCLGPLVAAGYEVIATHRGADPPIIDGVNWVESDLLHPAAAQTLIASVQPEQLLHMAWFVEPGAMIEHEDNLRWTAASLELLRAFKHSGGGRCVMTGSCYEYDWRLGYCSEDLTPAVPDTLYGAAKHALSVAMLQYCRSVGLSGAWARLFFLYGPHENPRRLVPAVTLSLLRGEPAKSSHGLQVRDYMHVQDAADGVVALLRSDAEGVYNITSGEPTSIRTIVQRIGDIVGRPELLQIGALPARANDLPLVVGNPEKTARDIGWQSRIDLDPGLTATVDWWRQREGET